MKNKIIITLEVVLMIIVSIIILTLDMSNLFTNKGNINIASLSIANINIVFWIIYIGILIISICIKNVINKNKGNLESILLTLDLYENENKVYQDQNMIYNLYNANKISEPTLWIKNSKKYEEKIKNQVKCNFELIRDFSNKEQVFKSFLLDLKKMYNLYEDIELINLYVRSEKEKKYYNVLERFKKENLENLRSPKYIITRSIRLEGREYKIIKLLSEVSNQETYENLVIEVRDLYQKELVRLVKTVNMKI